MAPPTKEQVFKAMKRLHRKYVRHCQYKNIYWEIPLEAFHKLTSSPCHYCGKEPSQITRSYIYNGLDRMNPKLGYQLCNVVPCCKSCNWIKGDRLSYEEMKIVGEALTNYRKLKARTPTPQPRPQAEAPRPKDRQR